MRASCFFFLCLIFLLFGRASILYPNDILPKNNTQNKVYFIKVLEPFGPINAAYYSYLKDAIEKINQDVNTRAVIIEIDSPGGTVQDAQKIVRLIQGLKQLSIAFINDSAYSAGAIIALAADYTIMTQTAKIGSAFPIQMNPKSGQAQSIQDNKVYKKILSGLTGLIEALAQKRQRRLIHDIHFKPSWYSHLLDGKSIRNLDKILAAMIDPEIQLTQENESYFLRSGDILTLTSDAAYRVGVIDTSDKNLNSILKSFDLEESVLEVIEPGFKGKLLSILTHPLALSLLVSLGTIGLTIELWTPTWGIAGTIGALCISTFFIVQTATGTPDFIPIVLFIAGFALILLELFLVPGFGILGFIGLSSLSGSLFMSIKSNAYLGHGLGVFETMYWVILSSILIIIGFYFIFKFFGSGRLLSKLILKDVKISATSFDDSYSLTNLTNVLNKSGKALTPLRPSGTILLDSKRYDAITEGGFINKDSLIQVISAKEGQLLVKEQDEQMNE